MRLELRSLASVARFAAAWALVCALAMPALALAQQARPTLGELARLEAERRKALRAPTKVYTKDDLPKSAMLPLTPPAAVPAPDAADAQKPATSDADEKDAKAEATEKTEKDEAWWRNRITQARESLRRNEMFVQALQTRINSLSADFVSRDDPLQRAQIAEDRDKALAEVELISKEIKTLHQQIADIEADARRSGVPAGWLR